MTKYLMLTIAQWQNDNAPVISCADGTWCCGDADCCNIASSVFVLAATVGPTSTRASSSTSSSTSSQATTSIDSSSATMTTSSVPMTSNSDLPAPSAGLPTAAKIGVGVGIPVVVILLGIIGLLAWKLKKRKNKTMPSELHGGTGHEKAGGSVVYAHEIDPVELDSQCLPVELGGIPRGELTGDEEAITGTYNASR